MGVPIVYRTGQQRPIASYDFYDLSEGTGIVQFYGGHTKKSTGDVYILTTQQIYSNDLSTAATLDVSGAFVKILDLDFDVTFSNAQRIKGGFTTTFSLILTSNTTATDIYAVINLEHRSGASGSVFATVQSETWSTLNNDEKTFTVKGDISDVENFKKDDILRLTIELWNDTNPATGAGTLTLTHDPQKRTVGTVNDTGTTQLLFYVPFVVEF